MSKKIAFGNKKHIWSLGFIKAYFQGRIRKKCRLLKILMSACKAVIIDSVVYYSRIDSKTLRRRKREVIRSGINERMSLNLTAHGGRFSFSVKHTEPVLHPKATVFFSRNGYSRRWNGTNPDCFLTGELASHNKQTAVFSFCDNLVCMFHVFYLYEGNFESNANMQVNV